MLQLGVLKWFLYIDCFILPLLNSILSTFCFTPPLPYYFHFSHAVCRSPDKLANPCYVKRNHYSKYPTDFLGRKWSILLHMQNWRVIWLQLIFFIIQRMIFKSLSRNFTSLKKKVYCESSFQSASTQKVTQIVMLSHAAHIIICSTSIKQHLQNKNHSTCFECIWIV